MCGRFTRMYTWREIYSMYMGIKLIHPDEDPEPAFNIAPTQLTWALVPDGERQGTVVAQLLRWGLVPMWSKDCKGGYATINARVESAATKPAFRGAWKQRRCLVPASGYYEWPGEGSAKQPYFIKPAADPVLMFAGLYERWTPRDGGPPIDSFAIVTMDAAGPVAEMHDRMPLILPPELCRDWVEGDEVAAAALAQAAPVPNLQFHAVDKAVGNVRNQGERLIAPLEVATAETPRS